MPWLPSAQESDLDFVFPPAMKGFRRQRLPVPAGGNVCSVLKRSSDGWMRRPVRGPNRRAVVKILLPQFSEFISVMRQFTIECRLCSISSGCRCNGGGHAHVQGRAASGDSSGSESIGRPGLRSCEPLGFRGNAWVCQFHAADYGVNARVVLPRGFGVAAGFCVLQLRVQEGATASSLAISHPDSRTESFLHVGDVIVRREDTSRARVQVVKPLVGDLGVAQVLNPGDLLPGTLGEERVLQAPETRPISVS